MSSVIRNYEMWHAPDVAIRYEVEHQGTTGRFIEECEISSIINAVHHRAPNRLLDAGCGTGRHLSRIRNVPEVYGIDYSEFMLAMAQKKIPEGHFFRGTIHKMPFDENFFDMIICVRVFQHLGDIVAPLREFHRILQPGGEAHILVYNRWHCHALGDRFRHTNFARNFSSKYPKGTYWNRLFRDYYNRFYSPRELLETAKQVGFSKSKLVGATVGPAWFLSSSGIDRMKSRNVQGLMKAIVTLSRTWNRLYRVKPPFNYFFDTIILELHK